MLDFHTDPRELQIFGLHWNPEAEGSQTTEEMDQKNRTDERSNETEGKQAKSKGVLFPFM